MIEDIVTEVVAAFDPIWTDHDWQVWRNNGKWEGGRQAVAVVRHRRLAQSINVALCAEASQHEPCDDPGCPLCWMHRRAIETTTRRTP